MKKTEYHACCKAWMEGWRERLLARAQNISHPFYRGFYLQLIESTTADVAEVFFELPLRDNYFKARVHLMEQGAMLRFYKLAALHHTLCALKRRKELSWAILRPYLKEVYAFNEQELQLADLLKQCILTYKSGFSELYAKLTARILFGEESLCAFSFAFIGNFWYNSYQAFMQSFTGYVPFATRMKRAQ